MQAEITITGKATLNLDGASFPHDMTAEQRLAYWLEGANSDPLLAIQCLEIKYEIKGELSHE